MATDGPDNSAVQIPDPPVAAKWVFTLTRLRWKEPDPEIRRGFERTPLAYAREFINDKPSEGIFRSDIEKTRRAIIRRGGVELYGMYRLFVVFALDSRSHMRGFLVDHRGRPASPRTIAETFGLDHKGPALVAWGLRMLGGDEIDLLRRVDYRDAWHQQWLLAALQGRQEDAERPKSRDGENALPETRNDQADAQGARRENYKAAGGGGPPVRAGPAVGRREAVATTTPAANRNGNGNGQQKPPADAGGKRAGLAACDNGQTETKTAVTATATCATDNENENDHPNRHTAAGPPNGPGSRPHAGTGPGTAEDDPTRPACPARSDGDGGPPAGGPAGIEVAGFRPVTGAGAQEPHAGTGPGTAEDGLADPAAPARPDMGATRQADGGGEVEICPDAELWEPIRSDPICPNCWATVSQDRGGLAFGQVIYRALGYSFSNRSARGVKREIGSFKGRWQMAMAAPIDDAARLELCERGIRKARHLHDQARQSEADGSEPLNRGKVWNAWWRKALGAAIKAAAEAVADGLGGKGGDSHG